MITLLFNTVLTLFSSPTKTHLYFKEKTDFSSPSRRSECSVKPLIKEENGSQTPASANRTLAPKKNSLQPLKITGFSLKFGSSAKSTQNHQHIVRITELFTIFTYSIFCGRQKDMQTHWHWKRASFLKKNYLSVWFHWALVVARGIYPFQFGDCSLSLTFSLSIKTSVSSPLSSA